MITVAFPGGRAHAEPADMHPGYAFVWVEYNDGQKGMYKLIKDTEYAAMAEVFLQLAGVKIGLRAQALDWAAGQVALANDKDPGVAFGIRKKQ